MRKSGVVVGLALLLAGGVSGGCNSTPVDFGSTPTLSSTERNQAIWHNWNREGAQMVDDYDRVMLLRPSSSLTYWHVR